MKLECQTALLRNAVQLLQPVCPLRTTMPILSNLLVKAVSGQIELVATDLDLTVKTKIPADVAEEGETTIPVATTHSTSIAFFIGFFIRCMTPEL